MRAGPTNGKHALRLGGSCGPDSPAVPCRTRSVAPRLRPRGCDLVTPVSATCVQCLCRYAVRRSICIFQSMRLSTVELSAVAAVDGREAPSSGASRLGFACKMAWEALFCCL
jgi:hypothetical protein